MGQLTGTSGRIRRSETRDLLQARVSDKDMPGTEVVLITCGAPDDRGYVCPLDVFIPRFVVELVEQGELQCNPDHLEDVAWHRWATHEWFRGVSQTGSTAAVGMSGGVSASAKLRPRRSLTTSLSCRDSRRALLT
jgi:hypothetical protein